MSSQNAEILSYLMKGKTLTPIEALQMFGSFRLAARVYELKNLGHPIVSEKITVGDGQHVASYSIDFSSLTNTQ